MPISELLTGLAAMVLTLGLLTYLVADNPLYRILSHLFIGITAGYVALLAWYMVIEPQLFAPLAVRLTSGSPLDNLRLLIVQVVGVVGGLLLLLKSVHVAGRLGSVVVALMVGVGVAVAVGGGFTGTLIPQALATMVGLLPIKQSNWPELAVQGLFTVIGTLTTLGFFYYGGRPQPGRPGGPPAPPQPPRPAGAAVVWAPLRMGYA